METHYNPGVNTRPSPAVLGWLGGLGEGEGVEQSSQAVWLCTGLGPCRASGSLSSSGIALGDALMWSVVARLEQGGWGKGQTRNSPSLEHRIHSCKVASQEPEACDSRCGMEYLGTGQEAWVSRGSFGGCGPSSLRPHAGSGRSFSFCL